VQHTAADDARPEQRGAPASGLLPHRYTAGEDAAGRDAILSLVIDEAHAVVRRRLSGVAMTMVIPIAAFRGVAVRISDDLDEIGFQLVHTDPGLTLPLGATATVDEAAQRLNLWASALRLPRLIVEPDGSETVIADERPRREVPPTFVAGTGPVRAFRVHQGGRG
jgi:hypothetical protein